MLGIGTTVTIGPTLVASTTKSDIQIEIELGKDGLKASDSFGIVHGGYLGRWKMEFESHWWGMQIPWQCTDPSKDGYIQLQCSQSNAKLSGKVGTSGGKKPFVNEPGHLVRSIKERMRYVLEIESDKNLSEGDVLTLTWKNAKAPDLAHRVFFMPFKFSLLPTTDKELPTRNGQFDLLPSIRVKGYKAESFRVTAQPLQAIGQPFELHIAAVDAYCNLAEDFVGAVALSSDPSMVVPKTVTFTRGDQGVKRIPIQGGKAGWYRIHCQSSEIVGESNYVALTKEQPEHQLYFGDMHSHTLDCDGTLNIDEHYHYAPNVAGLDFGAVSCHAEYFGTKAAWDRYLKRTGEANQPGRFITFYGYEWAQQGHTNAYFIDEKDAVLIWGKQRMMRSGYTDDKPPFRVGADDEAHLMEILDGLKVPTFTIAHRHSAYTSLDDKVHWLDEMYSSHGRNDKGLEARLRSNLAKGMYLGVVAGADGHRLPLGHFIKDPVKVWPSGLRTCTSTAGLQGTFSKHLTRVDLYEGMKNRYTYGTTGERMILLFECNGSPMGSRVMFDKNHKPTFSIEAGGTSDLSEVVLCRYDGKQWSEPFKQAITRTERYSGTWTDQGFDQEAIYYVRLTQANGERAWSSPIWVNHA